MQYDVTFLNVCK